MSTEIKEKAEAAAKMIEEVTSVTLAEPSTALVPLADANKKTATAIRKRIKEIDMEDTNSIVSFGSGAQAELQQISQAMLQDVKNKDVGPAGDSLRDIVGTSAGSRWMSWTPTASAAGGSVFLARQSRCMISWRAMKMCRARSTRLRMSC